MTITYTLSLSINIHLSATSKSKGIQTSLTPIAPYLIQITNQLDQIRT